MAVSSALRRTPGALRRNPIVFVPFAALMLFQLPQLALQAVHPLLASLASTGISLLFIVVMPFFQGGIVGMADEALRAPTSLTTFVEAGKANYVAVLIGYLIVVAVNFVVGLVVFFGAIVVGFGVLAIGGSGPSLVVLGIAALVGLVLALAYLLFVFFVQFYAQAIVIDDRSAVDGVKHSARVVRQNLLSTLGYTLVVGLVGAVTGLGFAGVSLLLTPEAATVGGFPALSLPVIAAVTLVVAIVGSLAGGFFGVFQVAFYREISPIPVTSDAGNAE